MSEPPNSGGKGQGHSHDRPNPRKGPTRRPTSGPGPKGNGRSGRGGDSSAKRTGPKPGAIGLARIGGNSFELVHPHGIKEVELDYEEGMELWKAGDPESARDALRYALSACHANIWIHTALGQIALEEFHDPTLARGHFGYAVDLGCNALSHRFAGRLPPDRPANRPFFEAIEGLLRCLEALKHPDDVRQLRAMRDRLIAGGS